MRLSNEIEVKAFKECIDSCHGPVYLCSQYGDQYNMKSQLNYYLAIADLIRDKGQELEIYASNREDEARLLNFLLKYQKKND